MNVFDVRIQAMRCRRDRPRRPFEVRWHAAGRARSRSFATRALADSYRAELIRAARRGLEFSPDTGEPALWAVPEPPAITWLEHAVSYAALKWPHLAARSRASLADALATITPALTRAAPGRPPAHVLRTALYRFAFNPSRAPAADPAAAQILDWARRASLPVARLADPAVLRTTLDALTFRLDGSRAAATTIARKRAVLHDALGYAAQAGLLESNPADHITWHPAKAAAAIDPKVVVNPAQARALLAAVTRIRPGQAAFFGCLYYAALRPEEAVALRVGDCHLPSHGWGQLTLSRAAPRTAAAWTNDGTSHELRGLKHQPDGTIRTVPIPPALVAMLGHHLARHGTAPDGRLFSGARGGPLSESSYGRAWQQARAVALGPKAATPLARRPYDLRHAALSTWLTAGADPAQIARRAGHRVTTLLAAYIHCTEGQDHITNHQIQQALHQAEPPTPPGSKRFRGPLAPAGFLSAICPCPARSRPTPAPPDPCRHRAAEQVSAGQSTLLG
jgi:integrase